MDDSVAIDAKRILLRYGAPIAILDKVTEPHRIEFARAIANEALDATEAAQCELFVEARELQDRVERQQVLDAAARVAFNAHEAAAEAPEAPEVRRATISPPRASACAQRYPGPHARHSTF